jgi:hypothetical protein
MVLGLRKNTHEVGWQNKNKSQLSLNLINPLGIFTNLKQAQEIGNKTKWNLIESIFKAYTVGQSNLVLSLSKSISSSEIDNLLIIKENAY